MEYINVSETLTIEYALQEMVESKTFESIDKEAQIGNIGEYEVKLKYNENNKIVIEYIQKATGTRIIYTLNPVGYTNVRKVDILLNVNSNKGIKSITKPDGLLLYPEENNVGIDYTVTNNGKYKFIIEDIEGTKTEKEVIVDTIDTLAPKDFEITAENTGTGLIITANTEDTEADENNVCSGIERYEYYIKRDRQTDYTKHDTNEIDGLEMGEYKIYVIAYDKAGNSKKSGTITTLVRAKLKLSQISISTTHALAIDEEGYLWSWGENTSGQLGIGESDYSYQYHYPNKVQGDKKFTKVDCDNYLSLALDTEGQLWGWGKGYCLGNMNSESSINLPRKLLEGKIITDICVGERKQCAVDNENVLYGSGNLSLFNTTPAPVSGFRICVNTTLRSIPIKAISIYDHILAINTNGNLVSWGNNDCGQSGNGKPGNPMENPPFRFNKSIIFKSVSANHQYSIAIDEEGYLWSWGRNHVGQLGDGSLKDKYVPTKITTTGLTKFQKIITSSNMYSSLAIDVDGNLWAWGSNYNLQLGNGTYNSYEKEPVLIKEGTKFKGIDTFTDKSVSIDVDGNLWAWGTNIREIFKDAIVDKSNVPIKVFE